MDHLELHIITMLISFNLMLQLFEIDKFRNYYYYFFLLLIHRISIRIFNSFDWTCHLKFLNIWSIIFYFGFFCSHEYGTLKQTVRCCLSQWYFFSYWQVWYISVSLSTLNLHTHLKIKNRSIRWRMQKSVTFLKTKRYVFVFNI